MELIGSNIKKQVIITKRNNKTLGGQMFFTGIAKHEYNSWKDQPCDTDN